MTQEDMIPILEAYWSEPNGCFWLIRTGVYTPNMFDEVYKTLSELQIDNDEYIDKRLVSLLWFIPVFLGWQKDQLNLEGELLLNYSRGTQKIIDLLIDVLGCP